MIKEFTYSRSTDVAVLRISGEDFHRDLHRIASVVHKDHRRFNGTYWHIQLASLYKEDFKEWWPEFVKQIEFFENQLELPLMPSGIQEAV